MTNYPVNLVLEMCSVCNLRCIMCPYPDMKRPRGYMGKELYEKIINEISLNSPKDTTLWFAFMGEPLLHTAIFSRIEYAKKKGIENLYLNTNATMVNPDVADTLKNSGIDKIFVSVDAFKNETYGKIKGVPAAALDIIEEKIEHLLDASLDVTVQFISMPENEAEEENFKNLWMKRGIRVKVRRALGWGGNIETVPPKTKRDIPCPWLMRQMIILWDGCVAQCDGDYEGDYSPGDINDSTIYEVWQHKLHDLRKRHIEGDYNFEPCKNCSDWSVGLSELYE